MLLNGFCCLLLLDKMPNKLVSGSVLPCVEYSLRRLLCHTVQLHLQALSLLDHRVHVLVQLAPRCVPPPHQTAGRLALCCQRGRAPQRVLPAAACLFLLLEVLRAALMQPGQLLQEGGALGSQRLASADPTLERRLRWEGAA